MCVPDVCSRCVFTRVKQVGFRCVERSPTTRGCEGMKQGMKYHCMMCLRSVDGIARIVLLLLLHTHTKHTHRSQKGTRSFGSASRWSLGARLRRRERALFASSKRRHRAVARLMEREVVDHLRHRYPEVVHRNASIHSHKVYREALPYIHARYAPAQPNGKNPKSLHDDGNGVLFRHVGRPKDDPALDPSAFPAYRP